MVLKASVSCETCRLSSVETRTARWGWSGRDSERTVKYSVAQYFAQEPSVISRQISKLRAYCLTYSRLLLTSTACLVLELEFHVTSTLG